MPATRWLLREYRYAVGHASLLDIFAVGFVGWLIWPIPIAIAAVLGLLHLIALFIDLILVSARVASRVPRALMQRKRTVVIERPRLPAPERAPVPVVVAPPPTKGQLLELLTERRRLESRLIEQTGLPEEDRRALQNEADDRFRDRVRQVLR